MGRRERYIALTDAQLQQRELAEQAKQKQIENRRRLTDRALRFQGKEQLVQILTKLCVENIQARWSIEAELEMSKPVELILLDIREAIRRATQVDEKRINHNPPVDWEAYAEVKRLMEMLVSVGASDEAMEIAIHFMGEASRQIEYSDEGMMLEEVEACLQPILDSLKDFDERQRALWSLRMQAADRVGFVCHDKLQSWSNCQRFVDL